MTANYFHNCLKQNQKFQQQSENDLDIWGKTQEDRLEERKKIKRQWRNQQKIFVGKIRQKETQTKSVKTIFWSLGIMTILVILAPNFIKFGHQQSTENLPSNYEDITQNKDSTLVLEMNKFQEKIKKRSDKLQRAIDLSDGKHISLSEEK